MMVFSPVALDRLPGSTQSRAMRAFNLFCLRKWPRFETRSLSLSLSLTGDKSILFPRQCNLSKTRKWREPQCSGLLSLFGLCRREIESLYLSASPFKIPFVICNEKGEGECENPFYPMPMFGSVVGGRCLQKTAVDKTSIYLLPRLTGWVRCWGNGGKIRIYDKADVEAPCECCKREFVQASNCNLFRGNSSFGPVRLSSRLVCSAAAKDEFGGEKGLREAEGVGMTDADGNPGFDLQRARR